MIFSFFSNYIASVFLFVIIPPVHSYILYFRAVILIFIFLDNSGYSIIKDIVCTNQYKSMKD
jgi:hypothetical protein